MKLDRLHAIKSLRKMSGYRWFFNGRLCRSQVFADKQICVFTGASLAEMGLDIEAHQDASGYYLQLKPESLGD